MNSRRWAVTGMIVAASMSLAVAGCSTTSGTSQPEAGTSSAASSPAKDPKQDLADALKPLSDTPFHMVITGGSLSGEGDADPAQKNAQMTLNVLQPNGSNAMKIGLITMGDQMWMQVSVNGAQIPGLPAGSATKWLHVDTTKLGPNSRAGMASGAGPVDSTKLLEAANEVQRVDSTHFKGTLDLTQGKSMAIDDKTISGLADKAKAIPFEATVDDQHRLAELKITIPAVGQQAEQVIDTKYSNFGTAVSISAPPPGQVAEAPAQIYQMFQA